MRMMFYSILLLWAPPASLSVPVFCIPGKLKLHSYCFIHTHTIRWARWGDVKHVWDMSDLRKWLYFDTWKQPGEYHAEWVLTWKDLKAKRKKQTETLSLRSEIFLHCAGLYYYCLLRDKEGKVLLPIMAHWSGSICVIFQLQMRGCSAHGGKRNIKPNLTTFTTKKARGDITNIICYKMFLLGLNSVY